MTDKENSGSAMVWVVIIGVVLVTTAGAFGWAWYKTQYLEAVAQQNGGFPFHAEMKRCPEKPATPWAQLIATLEANEPTATKAWTSECSRISGVVVEVPRDGSFVLIAPDADHADQAFSCLTISRERGAKLARGQPLSVMGFGQPKRGPRYELRDCDWAP